MRTAVRPSDLLMFTSSVGRDTAGQTRTPTIHFDGNLTAGVYSERVTHTRGLKKKKMEKTTKRRGGRKAPTRPAITTQPLNNHKKSKWETTVSSCSLVFFRVDLPSSSLPPHTYIRTCLYYYRLVFLSFSQVGDSALEPMSRFRHIRSVVDSRPKVAVKHDNFRKKYNTAGLFFSFPFIIYLPAASHSLWSTLTTR